MEVTKKYVVYNKIYIITPKTIALIKVDFGSCNNCFDSEEEAIEKIIEEKKTYIDYVILREIYIITE